MTGTGQLLRATLAALALVGAVSVSAGPATAAARGGKVIALGTGDDGSAITVHVGDTLNVRLKPDQNFHFETPTSSDDTVLHKQGGGRGHGHHHNVTGGRASFVARVAGEASLESFGTIACGGHHVCPAERGEVDRLIARRWHVDVTVE